MCGIAGIVSPCSVRYAPALDAMLRALSHRGPDGEGRHFFDNIALGHRRLSIIDLTGGAQPMLDARGRTAVVFNGEIYGYRELRAQLSDYRFRTDSDTELLLALYERYGVACVDRVPGMFAFAVWDEPNQRLLCARDRFGEKPFYYAFGPAGELVFASEIKAILASGLVDPQLSSAAVAHYLRRLYVHPHTTIYRNVFVLPPGHFLIHEAGKTSISRYWNLPAAGRMLTLEAAADEFRHLLRQAVHRQLVADVPVGAFLSGGLDSTTIVACAREWVPDIRTFSFDFSGKHSEIEYARAAAREYGTRHTELAADAANLADLMVRMCEVYDEPFGDSSSIPTYLLAREASRHAKVVLTGDGGDELLGGYDWYKPLAWMQATDTAEAWKLLLAKAASRFCRTFRISAAERAEQRALGVSYRRRFRSVLQAHVRQLAFFSDSELASLGLGATTVLPDDRALGCADESLDAAMRFDVIDYMPGDILVKIDRASMAHGLELRAPFLDVELASFCIGLPSALKVDTTADKRLLRAAFASSWPAAIRQRRKQGFGAPLEQWLSRPDVVELMGDATGSFTHYAEIIDPRSARYLLCHGTSVQRWALAILAVWLDRYRRNEYGRSNAASGAAAWDVRTGDGRAASGQRVPSEMFQAADLRARCTAFRAVGPRVER